MIINLPVRKMGRVEELVELMDAALNNEEYNKFGRKAVLNTLVKTKFNLKRNERLYKTAYKTLEEKKAILQLTYQEEIFDFDTDKQYELIDYINSCEEIIASCNEIKLETGRIIINISELASKFLSDNDLANILNLNIKEVERLRQKFYELDRNGFEPAGFMNYLIFSGNSEMCWLMHDAITSVIIDEKNQNPQLAKEMDEKLVKLLEPLQKYNVKFNRYGEIEKITPVLGIIK